MCSIALYIVILKIIVIIKERVKNKMKKFKVFIASSNDESIERDALKQIINNTSKITEKYGIEIIPKMWELMPVDFKQNLERKQNEYNEALEASNMAFFLFSKRVGTYTHEEFDTACDLIKSGSPLKMFVYFKNIQLGNVKSLDKSDVYGIEDIINLKNHIMSIGQVFGEYEYVSEIQSIAEKEILEMVIPMLISEHQYDSNIQRLIELYKDTDKPYQIDKRDSIIEDALNSLFFLYKYNYTPKLDETSFYELCHNVISSTRAGSSINALSLMLKCEWDDSEDERNFWKDNKNAVKRRVKLERIFLVNKNEAHRLKTNPQIKNHIDLEDKSNCIHSYIVEKEMLQNDPTLLDQAGNGFIIIDSEHDKLALLDETPLSEQRAKPVLDSGEFNEISNVFNKIKKYSTPLKQYLNNIAWSHYKKEMISIFVTTKCNLNCDYCFTNKNQDEHKGQTILIDFVKKGIDDYFETDYMRHVRFFGAGEPTVEIDLLKEIHKYAIKKGGPSVTFEIQTNGAFSDAVANWLKDNIDIIWISCDGTPEIQDKHRPFYNDSRKTSAVIEKNIRILNKPTNKSFVGIRATITTENITKQKEMIDYFYKLGIRDIWVDPIFPSVSENIHDEGNSIDMMLFADEFIQATKYANSKNMFYGSILTCNFDDTVNKHCRACLPVPHLTTDGFVSACDMALFGNDKNHMSKLIYGHWVPETGEIHYDQQRIDYLRSRTTENLQHCEMCSAKEHCGGYCLGEVLNETKDLFGQKTHACQAIRYLNEKLDSKYRKYTHTHP